VKHIRSFTFTDFDKRTNPKAPKILTMVANFNVVIFLLFTDWVCSFMPLSKSVTDITRKPLPLRRYLKKVRAISELDILASNWKKDSTLQYTEVLPATRR
jgi:hypothetical protein